MAKTEIILGDAGNTLNLGNPDVFDRSVFASTDANPTTVISVSKKPRYVIMSLSSAIPTNGNNLCVTYADRDNNISKTLIISGSDTPLEYSDVGMVTNSIMGGAGLISVTDNAVTIKGQPYYRGLVITAIYY